MDHVDEAMSYIEGLGSRQVDSQYNGVSHQRRCRDDNAGELLIIDDDRCIDVWLGCLGVPQGAESEPVMSTASADESGAWQ